MKRKQKLFKQLTWNWEAWERESWVSLTAAKEHTAFRALSFKNTVAIKQGGTVIELYLLKVTITATTRKTG